jgi:selenide,water dikinase
VEDDELKYGLSLTGLIAPEHIIRNSTARPGDQLILTKPLGTGIVSTAIKGEMASAAVIAEAVGWMTTLNRAAAELMAECQASAATDVTGFGLIGHCSEMARGAGVTLRLYISDIPLMCGVTELAADGMLPAGCYRNRDHYLPLISSQEPESDRLLPLFDPQTSGGMLIALAPSDAERFMTLADARGIFARVIGAVLPKQERWINIV